MASSLRVTCSTNDSRKANTVPADSSVAAATNDIVTAPTAPVRGRSCGAKAVVNTEAPAEETTPVVTVIVDLLYVVIVCEKNPGVRAVLG